MTWSVALYHPPSAPTPRLHGKYATIKALRAAVAQLQGSYRGREILFRFETPKTATGAEIDELRCLGLVNGEVLGPE
jgi:hypothetical protein